MRLRTTPALRQPKNAARRRPSWLDWLLVLVFAVPAPWSGRHGAVGVIMAVAVALPVLGRRRAPVAMFATAWVLAAVQGLLAAPTFSDSSLLVTLYTIGATQPRRTVAAAWAVLEVGVAVASAKFGTPGLHRLAASFIALSAMGLAAVVIGINVGNRRQVLAALRERAERLESEREHEVALAKVAERARIAREMHDVVAHNLSVMVALCDGAAYHVHESPERAESALQQAAQTGREALAEMRQLLGVLRDAPPDPLRAPQPNLAQVAALVEHVRQAGLPVRYTVSGDLHQAASGMELAIYRIVQEALTNTLKHGGPGATASVTLACDGDTVDVEVSDTGIGGARRGDGGGGLRGMSERAALYGGTLHAGPRPGGGWTVRARLGIPAPAAR